MNRKVIIIVSTIVIIFVILLVVLFAGKGKDVDYGETMTEQESRQEQEKERAPPEGYETDKDRDGILDSLEKSRGLSSETFDTDGDGLDDNTEMEITKTDPLKPDTDGDGLHDGEEVIYGSNPLGE